MSSSDRVVLARHKRTGRKVPDGFGMRAARVALRGALDVRGRRMWLWRGHFVKLRHTGGNALAIMAHPGRAGRRRRRAEARRRADCDV